MGLLITLLILGVIFFVFIKKGRNGKSFYKYRNDIHDFVAENGGMLALYEHFADYFRNKGFNVREVNKDSMYLHYGSDKGKIGIQLIQNAIDEVEVTVSTVKPGDAISKSSFKFDSNTDQDTMIKLILQNYNRNNSKETTLSEQVVKSKTPKNNQNSKPEIGYTAAGAIGQFLLFIFLFIAPFILAALVADATKSGAAAVTVFIVTFIGVIAWYMNKD